MVAEEPHLLDDVLFGAQAVTTLEGRFTRHLLDRWAAGATSLVRPLDPRKAVDGPGPSERGSAKSLT